MGYKIPRSVLVVIHNAEREVLLLERADVPGFWQSVTGSQERSEETMRETALRELQEETGIDVISNGLDLRDWNRVVTYEILPQWRHRYSPEITSNQEFQFDVCIPKSTVIRIASKEHLQFRWFDWREAMDQCFSPSNREAIRQLSSRYWKMGD